MWVLPHIITIPSLYPNTQIQDHNLDLVVAFHTRRKNYKAAPRNREHNNPPQTSKLEGECTKTRILQNFTLPNNSQVFLCIAIQKTTGYTLQDWNYNHNCFAFYTLILPMGKKIHPPEPKLSRSYPQQQSLYSNMGKPSETEHSTPGKPGIQYSEQQIFHDS